MEGVGVVEGPLVEPAPVEYGGLDEKASTVQGSRTLLLEEEAAFACFPAKTHIQQQAERKARVFFSPLLC